MTRTHLSGVVVLLLALGMPAAAAPGAGAAPSSIELQRARAQGLKTKGWRQAYTKRFDLSGLPEYKPTRRLTGVIRQWGSNYLADSPLESSLEAEFRKYQPEIRFENNLSSTFIAMAGLYTKRADLAPMGRRPTWDELQSYQRVFGTLPAEIVMATGSYDVSGWSFALVPMVNAKNPLATLTLAQLDGIFGAQRQGGWRGNSWDERAARGSGRNLRTWGQLGLTGAWANKPIHVYGYNLNYHFPRDFAEKVMGGGDKWNEALVEFGNKLRTDAAGGDFGRLWSAGDQLTDAVAADPYAITYTGMLYGRKPGVKTVPLAGNPSGPFVMPTLESVQDRSYPLAREVYIYANRPAGGRIDPLFAEYLRFVVSRQGQEAVMKDGKYLPLTPALARAQLREIEAIGAASTADSGG
ncbi:MAG: phosphate transport system substrate-binding protein [Sphingomonadales bacterium]|jgi:phosphate transport system substrate-binding protein|nr:phosphate transport system substrate-binding protein [Sphingomonadales bacterium]